MVIAEGAKMSKSKGNVVGADMLAEKFGADTGRMFVLFAAPPEKKSTGAPKAPRASTASSAASTASPRATWGSAHTCPQLRQEVLRKLHQTLKKITEDFETRWHFNTCIASIMELVNVLYAEEAEYLTPPPCRRSSKSSP